MGQTTPQTSAAAAIVKEAQAARSQRSELAWLQMGHQMNLAIVGHTCIKKVSRRVKTVLEWLANVMSPVNYKKRRRCLSQRSRLRISQTLVSTAYWTALRARAALTSYRTAEGTDRSLLMKSQMTRLTLLWKRKKAIRSRQTLTKALSRQALARAIWRSMASSMLSYLSYKPWIQTCLRDWRTAPISDLQYLARILYHLSRVSYLSRVWTCQKWDSESAIKML